MATFCPVSYTIGTGFNVLLTSFVHLGFWQYGLIDWELFYGCLRTVISTEDDWAVFKYEENAPGEEGRFALQTTNSLTLEHISFFNQVSNDSQLSECPFLYMISCRWFSYPPRFDTRFGSHPPSNRLQHSFSGTSHTPTGAYS
jgi:hypothetical protein